MTREKTSAKTVGFKEQSSMSASVCKMEYPAPDVRMHRTNIVRSRTAHPGATRVEAHAYVEARDLGAASEAAETVRPVQSASLAEIAHDLCSPLSALTLLAHSLREGRTLDDESESVDSIVRISEHALNLLRDLLDEARIEAGCENLRSESCDLQLLLGDVTDVSRPRAQAKNLELIVRRDPACPRYVHTDAIRLQRILINVLENAVKYTAQGSVTLSLSSAESRDPRRVWLIFEIQDTGIGIARRDQNRVFERFVRGSGAAGTNGSGLGLTIASQLVRLMGGAIRVESKQGSGSKFRIELPVARTQGADGSIPAPAAAKIPLPAESLAALPCELRAELRESVLKLDVPRIHKAIERIAERNAPLGAILESYASQYEFTEIFKSVTVEP